MNEWKKHYVIGPGGTRCACCYPAPGKGRKRLERTFKRAEKQHSKKAISEEIE